MRVFLATIIALSSSLLFWGFYSSNLAYGQEAGTVCPPYLEIWNSDEGKLERRAPVDCASYAENYYFKLMEEGKEAEKEEAVKLNTTIVVNWTKALFE